MDTSELVETSLSLIHVLINMYVFMNTPGQVAVNEAFEQ